MPGTRIVATVGPACATEETLRAMNEAGADVFRVNCSHNTTEQSAQLVGLIRRAVPEAGILLDVQGPKLRSVGVEVDLVEGSLVALGDLLAFDPKEAGIRAGERVLLADGRFELRVVEEAGFLAEVVRGGRLGARKGVNLPETDVRTPGLSRKDLADLVLAREQGVEWVAISFVRDAGAISAAREILGDTARIVAKIERREAVLALEEIAKAADGLMTARGDLGVELPLWQVPQVQAEVASIALRLGKVSICATEMLESMITNSRPTRAEVADVAGAVVQGYAAVMLSAETAAGSDPVGVVATMRSICDENAHHGGHKIFADAHPERAAVAAAASALALRTGSGAILSLTLTGYSAETLSACRPPARIIAATEDPAVARRLRLHWGVEPIVSPRRELMRDSVREVCEIAREDGLLRKGENIVVTANRGNPSGPADTIWIHKV